MRVREEILSDGEWVLVRGWSEVALLQGFTGPEHSRHFLMHECKWFDRQCENATRITRDSVIGPHHPCTFCGSKVPDGLSAMYQLLRMDT